MYISRQRLYDIRTQRVVHCSEFIDLETSTVVWYGIWELGDWSGFEDKGGGTAGLVSGARWR